MENEFQEIIKGIVRRKELKGDFDIKMANKIRQKKDISIKEKIALGEMYQPFIAREMKNKELFKKMILVSLFSNPKMFGKLGSHEIKVSLEQVDEVVKSLEDELLSNVWDFFKGKVMGVDYDFTPVVNSLDGYIHSEFIRSSKKRHNQPA